MRIAEGVKQRVDSLEPKLHPPALEAGQRGHGLVVAVGQRHGHSRDIASSTEGRATVALCRRETAPLPGSGVLVDLLHCGDAEQHPALVGDGRLEVLVLEQGARIDDGSAVLRAGRSANPNTRPWSCSKVERRSQSPTDRPPAASSP